MIPTELIIVSYEIAMFEMLIFILSYTHVQYLWHYHGKFVLFVTPTINVYSLFSHTYRFGHRHSLQNTTLSTNYYCNIFSSHGDQTILCKITMKLL